MGNYRKKYTDNEKQYLFDETEGLCPICGKSLTYKKNERYYKSYQIAHIYPLNPTNEERLSLDGEKRLSTDVNDLKNVLAVCLDCHIKFDHPRTKEEYRNWVEYKKTLLRNNQLKEVINLYPLEDEIRIVMKKLNESFKIEENINLEFDSLTIDEKANDTLSNVLKKTIKNNVVDYFTFIKEEFKELEKNKTFIFDNIASQINSAYRKTQQIDDNQDFIYRSLVGWVNKKTNNYSDEVSRIIVAYFIQDCEVFS
jgi:hypothetical protein